MKKRKIIILALFLISIGSMIHTYFTYALSLVLLSRNSSDEESQTYVTTPSVALVIAAYNEEEIIAEKIENSIDLDYPRDKLEIIVFSDASGDRTDDIVRSYADQGVRLERIEGRVGKTQCQNQVAETVNADIIVFSDANSMYESSAISNLVQEFSEGVGCVVGELRYRQANGTEGESVYWRYEQLIKKLESKVGSLVTGNGSIYAVQNESYVPLASETISDFAEPLAIVSNGETVKYAPDAVAWEDTGSSTQTELSRRIRITTRCWNTLVDYLHLLNPIDYSLFSYQLLSHKLLRWLSPIFLILICITNLLLVALYSRKAYRYILSLQTAFYSAAVVGWLFDRAGKSAPTILHVPYYFIVANYGMLAGLWNFLKGKNVVTWETTDRNSANE